ncbi:MAG: hypothetical protein ACP5UT_09600 [Bryobacteraceae bacterium]
MRFKTGAAGAFGGGPSSVEADFWQVPFSADFPLLSRTMLRRPNFSSDFFPPGTQAVSERNGRHGGKMAS